MQRVKLQPPPPQQLQQQTTYMTNDTSGGNNASSWHTPTMSNMPAAVSPPPSGPGDTFKILLPKMGGGPAPTATVPSPLPPTVKKELTMGTGGGDSMTITEVKVG
jgi:hypothetical protein